MNKVALITGGSRGIGAAIALRLASQGIDVALTYVHSAAEASAVACAIRDKGCRAVTIRADNADAVPVVDEVVSTLGRLDILVHNAGVFQVGPLEDLGAAEFDRTVAVNVRAPYLLSRAALPHLPEGGGRIICVGSNMAERVPFPGMTLYALSKTALVGLTKGLARELGPRGITVNLVHPGPTDTAANPADGPAAPTISGFTALGRYATPAEIASVVGFLASDEAGYVTGAVVNVDGGFTV